MVLRTKRIIAVCVGAPLLILGALAFKIQWDYWSWQRKTAAFTESLQKPFKEDSYGGKTPEETWEMFLDAMEKKDIDLAVKYFFFYDREKQKDRFLYGLTNGRFDAAVSLYRSSTLIKEDPPYTDSTKAYYHIRKYNEKEGYFEALSVNFELNKYTKVWKITQM